MAIPDYQTLMLPVLKVLADQKGHAVRDIVATLADEFALSEDERRQRLQSGAFTMGNRVAWARVYLGKAGLLETVRRGVLRITPGGSAVLGEAPARLDVRYLERFPEFVAFKNTRTSTSGEQQVETIASTGADARETPEEALDAAYARLRVALEIEVLEHVKAATPSFFEQLVVDVLVAMGYGGSSSDAGEAIGRGGDGGIDGIIKEDRLGLDVIYLQAKRWENTVGRPDIQRFAGALQGHRARKGVFITTSSFSRDARDYTASIDSKIVLIDGTQLAKLMIDHNVGVSAVRSYEIKKIDSDYFTEDES